MYLRAIQIKRDTFGTLFFFPVLCGMLMTASDVSAIAKPWEIQHKLAKRVADEFFDQGDMEKLRLNTQPIVSTLISRLCDHISKSHLL